MNGFGNRYTGSDHEKAMRLGRLGWKQKFLKMKWYLWILVILAVLSAITTMVTFLMYDFNFEIRTEDYILSIIPNVMLPGFSVVICFLFLFTYDTGMMGNIPSAVVSYRQYLKGKARNQKKKFIYTPFFTWLITYTMMFTAFGFCINYNVHRILGNSSDLVFNGFGWEPIPALILTILLLIFPMFYSKIVVQKGDYVKQIENANIEVLDVAVEYVNQADINFPWFKAAQEENKIAKTGNELRQKLGLPIIKLEEKQEETKIEQKLDNSELKNDDMKKD